MGVVICQRVTPATAVIICLILVGHFNHVTKGKEARLGSYLIDTDRITASGHSSGSSFVHNFHIVNSELLAGVGLFSGLYYQFNGVHNEPYTGGSADPPGVGVKNSMAYIRKYNKIGLIDDVSHLSEQKVFVYCGLVDEFHGVEERGYAVERIYQHYLANSEYQFKLVIKYATHSKPIGQCTKEQLAEGYECHYNGFRDMFRFLFGTKLKTRSRYPIILQDTAKFDQTEFFVGVKGLITMNDFGRIYVPSKCAASTFASGKKRKCLLHMHLHGCDEHGPLDASKNIQPYKYFYEIAEMNNMIIVIPFQNITTSNPNNPTGCWDYLGYNNGRNYATNKGSQMQVVRRIIERIIGTE